MNIQELIFKNKLSAKVLDGLIREDLYSIIWWLRGYCSDLLDKEVNQ